MDENVIERLQDAIAAFAVPLRMGEGFQEEAYETLCQELVACAHALCGVSVIPKRCASLLIELDPALNSTISWYLNDQDQLDRITHAIQNIYCLTLDCVS